MASPAQVVGSLTASGVVSAGVRFGNAALTGRGSLSAGGAQFHQGRVTFSAKGTTPFSSGTVVPAVPAGVGAAIVGAVVAAATTGLSGSSAATLRGTGTLTGSGGAASLQVGAANLSGRGTLSSAPPGVGGVQEASASLAGAGSVAASLSLQTKQWTRKFYAAASGVWAWAAGYDGTVITRNGGPLATGQSGATGTFAVTAGDVIASNFPVGMMVPDKARPAPSDATSGRNFGFTTSRYAPHTFHVYAVQASTVKYRLDGVPDGTTPSVTLSAGQVHAFAQAADGLHFITSTGDIVVESVPASGDGLTPLPASHNAMYWRNSSRATFAGPGPALLPWSGVAGAYFISGAPDLDLFAVNGVADGAGGDTDSGVPLGRTFPAYLIPHRLADWIVGSVESQGVHVEFWDGVAWQSHSILDLSGASLTNPVGVEFGSRSGADAPLASGAEPWRFTATDGKAFYLRLNDPATDDEYAPTGFWPLGQVISAPIALPASSSMLAADANFQTADASLRGAGTCAGVGSIVGAVPADLGAVIEGAVEAVGAVGVLGTSAAALAGRGSVSASGRTGGVVAAVATLAGAGRVTAALSPQGGFQYATAALTGRGTLVIDGQLGELRIATATLTGGGSLLAAFVNSGGFRFGQATLTGRGTQSANMVLVSRTAYGSSALVGRGTLTPQGTHVPPGSGRATPTGVGTLTANGVLGTVHGGQVTLTGRGSCAAVGTTVPAVPADLGVVIEGALESLGSLVGQQPGAVTLRGVGAVTASLTGGGDRFGTASLTGRGTLGGVGTVRPSEAGTLNTIIVGALDSLGSLGGEQAAAAVLTGVGELDSSGRSLSLARATLTGAGALLGAGTVRPSEAGTLNTIVTGALDAIGNLVGEQEGQGLLVGVGRVEADLTGGAERFGQAPLRGYGRCAGAGSIVPAVPSNTGMVVIGAIDAVGDLVGDRDAIAILSGVGRLEATPRLSGGRLGTGNLGGVGSCAAIGTVVPKGATWQGAAALVGRGSLTASADTDATGHFAVLRILGVGRIGGLFGRVERGQTQMPALGLLFARGRVEELSSAQLRGTGRMHGEARLGLKPKGSAVLRGVGRVTAGPYLIPGSRCRLDGVGTLVPRPVMRHGLSILLQGVGAHRVVPRRVIAPRRLSHNDGYVSIAGLEITDSTVAAQIALAMGVSEASVFGEIDKRYVAGKVSARGEVSLMLDGASAGYIEQFMGRRVEVIFGPDGAGFGEARWAGVAVIESLKINTSISTMTHLLVGLRFLGRPTLGAFDAQGETAGSGT